MLSASANRATCAVGGSDEFDAELKDDPSSASRLPRLIRSGQPPGSIIKADSCNYDGWGADGIEYESSIFQDYGNSRTIVAVNGKSVASDRYENLFSSEVSHFIDASFIARRRVGFRDIVLC